MGKTEIVGERDWARDQLTGRRTINLAGSISNLLRSVGALGWCPVSLGGYPCDWVVCQRFWGCAGGAFQWGRPVNKKCLKALEESYICAM